MPDSYALSNSSSKSSAAQKYLSTVDSTLLSPLLSFLTYVMYSFTYFSYSSSNLSQFWLDEEVEPLVDEDDRLLSEVLALCAQDKSTVNLAPSIMSTWKPNRHCTFRYLGDYRFIVEQSENSKLKVGNTFRCALFILGEPLYLNNLVQGDNPPVAFVVGNKDGLCELKQQ